MRCCQKYFNVHVSGGNLTADMEKVKTEDEAKTIAAACDKKQAVVSSVKREMKTVNPPKLYDLTTLQREANRYYGFTAQQTLDLVQSLYEKKLLTYPRTDSQFITDDMESTVRQIIGIVCRKVSVFNGLSYAPNIRRITNNAKVTDYVLSPRMLLPEIFTSESRSTATLASKMFPPVSRKWTGFPNASTTAWIFVVFPP